jgi:hypothetical protein
MSRGVELRDFGEKAPVRPDRASAAPPCALPCALLTHTLRGREQLLPTRNGPGADTQRELERRQRCAAAASRRARLHARTTLLSGCFLFLFALPAARQALLSGSDALARGTMRLEQGQRMLLETENMGNDVLVSLQRQRQQIKSAQCVRVPCALTPRTRVLPHALTAARTACGPCPRRRAETRWQTRARTWARATKRCARCTCSRC